MNPHLYVAVAWVPAEFPLARFACERRRDDGAFAGIAAVHTHKGVRISVQSESEKTLV